MDAVPFGSIHNSLNQMNRWNDDDGEEEEEDADDSCDRAHCDTVIIVLPFWNTNLENE